MKHFEATSKLQDELFRLKREEADSGAKLERSFLEKSEVKQRQAEERLNKIEM